MPACDKSHPEAGFVELEPIAIAAYDMVWVIGALFLAGLCFAGWAIFSVLDDILGGISIFGYHPFNVIAGLLKAAMMKLWSVAEGRLGAFTNWLYSQIAVIWRFMYVTVVSITGLWAQVVGLEQRNTNDLSSEAQRALAAEGNLQQQLNQEVGALGQEDGQLQGQIATIENTMIPELRDELSLLEARVNGLSVPDLSGIEFQLTTDIGNITSELQSVEANLNNTIANDVSSLTQQMAQQRNVLEGEIANGVSSAESFATGLVGGLGIGNILSTATTLASRLTAVEQDITECLDPLCDTVTPNAQRAGRNLNWLKNLEALGFEAALFALAAECLTNPQAVVDDVSTVVNDVGGPVMDAGKALIGL